MVRVGEWIQVTALKADGQAYRWWTGLVERISANTVVVTVPAGTPFYEPGRERIASRTWRSFFSLALPYHVTELYSATMEPEQLYIDIGSPACLSDDGLEYTDYELDVGKVPSRSIEVLDEAEFQEAIVTYGYSAALQAECRAALRQAVEVAEQWVWSDWPIGGIPGLESERLPSPSSIRQASPEVSGPRHANLLERGA